MTTTTRLDREQQARAEALATAHKVHAPSHMKADPDALIELAEFVLDGTTQLDPPMIQLPGPVPEWARNLNRKPSRWWQRIGSRLEYLTALAVVVLWTGYLLDRLTFQRCAIIMLGLLVVNLSTLVRVVRDEIEGPWSGASGDVEDETDERD